MLPNWNFWPGHIFACCYLSQIGWFSILQSKSSIGSFCNLFLWSLFLEYMAFIQPFFSLLFRSQWLAPNILGPNPLVYIKSANFFWALMFAMEAMRIEIRITWSMGISPFDWLPQRSYFHPAFLGPLVSYTSIPEVLSASHTALYYICTFLGHSATHTTSNPWIFLGWKCLWPATLPRSHTHITLSIVRKICVRLA